MTGQEAASRLKEFLQAEAEIGALEDRSQVRKAIARGRATVSGLESVLTAIKRYRDEWFAHLDPNTVADPQALNAAVKVTILDLDRAFEETEDIIKELARLLDGPIGPIRFVGHDDYKYALKHIRRSRQAEMAEFRKFRL